MRHSHARLLVTAPLMVSALALAGCMSAPTYGTGTPAHEQLLSDVTGVLSIAPSKGKPPIDYKPRPDLVKPAPGAVATLPPPQQSAIAAANQAWPESPEQRRQRLFNEATAASNEGRASPIVSDIKSKPGITSAARFTQQGNFEVEAEPVGGTAKPNQGITSAARLSERGNFELEEDPNKQRDAFNKRLADSRQGNPTSRKYLSEPPLVYREPAGSAPTGDVGEDEWKKDRRQKREARKGSSWTDWIPGL